MVKLLKVTNLEISLHTPNMKKYIISILIIATTGMVVFAAKKEKNKPITTKPEKGVFVTQVSSFVSCPAKPSAPDFFVSENSEDQKPYDHCPKCRMGVFFSKEYKMTCSYCENTIETVLGLP